MYKRIIQSVFGVIVLTFAPAAFDYNFAIAGTPIACDPEPTDMLIGYGDSTSCIFGVAGDSDVFRFNASAGEKIIVRSTRTSGTGGDPCIELVDPATNIADSLCGSGSVIIEPTLSQSGTYTIRTFSSNPILGFNYVLLLERIGPVSPAALPMPPDGIVNDALGFPGDNDFVFFQGSPGDSINIVVTRTSGTGGSPCIDLYDPASILADSICAGSNSAAIAPTLSQSGTYAIRTFSTNPIISFNYTLVFECLFGPCAPLPISPVCEIELSQSTYIDGETITANVFRLANLGPDPVTVDLKNWLIVPPDTAVSVFDLDDLTLPAGFDSDFGPFPLFAADPGFPRGSWEYNCRLLDPITGAERSFDQNAFEIQ